MQSVSQEWKDINQRPLINEGLLRIEVGLTDPDAIDDITTIDDTGHLSYSDASEIALAHQKIIPRYATLEQNQWVLDGQAVQYTKTGDVGYVSDEISGADRTCNETITVNFGEVHTIKWYPCQDNFFQNHNEPDTSICLQ